MLGSPAFFHNSKFVITSQGWRAHRELATLGLVGPFETELRAQFLGIAVFDLSRTVDNAFKLQSRTECLLCTLLRKRSAGTEEFRMVSPRRDSRIAQVESLSLEGKPLAEMTDDELTDRQRCFPFDRLRELASLQAEEQKQREIAELLAESS